MGLQPSVGELVMWFFVSHHRGKHTRIKCARNRNGYPAKKKRNKGNDSQSLLKWCRPSWQTLHNALHTSNYKKIHTGRGKWHCGNLCFKKWLQHCCQQKPQKAHRCPRDVLWWSPNRQRADRIDRWPRHRCGDCCLRFPHKLKICGDPIEERARWRRK